LPFCPCLSAVPIRSDGGDPDTAPAADAGRAAHTETSYPSPVTGGIDSTGEVGGVALRCGA